MFLFFCLCLKKYEILTANPAEILLVVVYKIENLVKKELYRSEKPRLNHFKMSLFNFVYNYDENQNICQKTQNADLRMLNKLGGVYLANIKHDDEDTKTTLIKSSFHSDWSPIILNKNLEVFIYLFFFFYSKF